MNKDVEESFERGRALAIGLCYWLRKRAPDDELVQVVALGSVVAAHFATYGDRALEDFDFFAKAVRGDIERLRDMSSVLPSETVR